MELPRALTAPLGGGGAAGSGQMHLGLTGPAQGSLSRASGIRLPPRPQHRLLRHPPLSPRLSVWPRRTLATGKFGDHPARKPVGPHCPAGPRGLKGGTRPSGRQTDPPPGSRRNAARERGASPSGSIPDPVRLRSRLMLAQGHRQAPSTPGKASGARAARGWGRARPLHGPRRAPARPRGCVPLPSWGRPSARWPGQ